MHGNVKATVSAVHSLEVYHTKRGLSSTKFQKSSMSIFSALNAAVQSHLIAMGAHPAEWPFYPKKHRPNSPRVCLKSVRATTHRASGFGLWARSASRGQTMPFQTRNRPWNRPRPAYSLQPKALLLKHALSRSRVRLNARSAQVPSGLEPCGLRRPPTRAASFFGLRPSALGLNAPVALRPWEHCPPCGH